MLLGTSPGVGAHEALVAGLSGPRGIPGARSLSPPPSAGMMGHSASPANFRGGFTALSSSPSENGNGNSMISGGGGGGVAGAGCSSLGSTHGSATHGHGRRRSGDLARAVYVKPVAPALSPTVTGFNVPHEDDRGDAFAGSWSQGGRRESAARMTQTFSTRVTSPAAQRSVIHQHDYALAGGGGGGGGAGGGGGTPPAPVVGFDADAASSSGAVATAGAGVSGGGLTRSLSAMQHELQSLYAFDGGVCGIEATIAVPAVSNAVSAASSSAAAAAAAARPPSGRKPPSPLNGVGVGVGSGGSFPRVAFPGGAANAAADEKPPSGLLSGVPPLEALAPEEEAMLFEAQGRHAAFASARVVSAFRVAAAAHRGQRRRSGDPVLRHCVETAVVLAQLGMDYGVVAAGLLHDVLDDTPVTAAELRAAAGAAVTGMVQGVSRLSRVSQISRDSGRALGAEERQRLRAMLIAMTDARVVIVKLADRLHNLNTLEHLAPDKARSIAEETLAVYVPLASRLGVWTLKARLEDACFARLHPEEHARLSAELEEGEQRAAITVAVEHITAALDDAGVTGYGDICGRPKSLFSVYRKMREKGVRLEDIHDVRALRVIAATEEDCYAALEAVHSRRGWSAVEGKTKDYVRNAKRNGYQSLHTVVRDEATGRAFEVQIRTADMHHAAEYGLAAHWRYKESGAGAEEEAAARGEREEEEQEEQGEEGGEEGEFEKEMNGSAVSAQTSLRKSIAQDRADSHGSDATHKAVDEQVAWARFMLSWQGQLADDKCRAESARGTGGGGGGGAAGGGGGELCTPCPCPFPTHHPECHNHEENLSFERCGAGDVGFAGAAATGARSSSMKNSSAWDPLDSPLVSADSASAGGCFFSPSSPLLDAAAVGAAAAVAPIFVIVVVDGEMRVLETPCGARLSDVDVVSAAGRSDRTDCLLTYATNANTYNDNNDNNGGGFVAVNREAVPPGAEVAVQLRMGDLIEVTTTTTTTTGMGTMRTTTRTKAAATNAKTKAAAAATAAAGCAALGSEAAAAVEKQRRRLSRQTPAAAAAAASVSDLDVSALNLDQLSTSTNNVVTREAAPKGFHP